MNRDDVLFCPDAAFEHAPKSRQFRKLAEKPARARTGWTSGSICLLLNLVGKNT